jgi:hypothetical protein
MWLGELTLLNTVAEVPQVFFFSADRASTVPS